MAIYFNNGGNAKSISKVYYVKDGLTKAIGKIYAVKNGIAAKLWNNVLTLNLKTLALTLVKFGYTSNVTATYSKISDYIKLSLTNGSSSVGSRVGVATTTPIDITAYNKLKIVFDNPTTTSTWAKVNLSYAATIGKTLVTNGTMEKVKTSSELQTTGGTLIMDISSLTGNYYIGAYANGCLNYTIQITEITLYND